MIIRDKTHCLFTSVECAVGFGRRGKILFTFDGEKFVSVWSEEHVAVHDFLNFQAMNVNEIMQKKKHPVLFPL